MPQVVTCTTNDEGEEGLDLSRTDHVRLFFQAQLTDEELELPVVQRMRSELPFEELDQLNRQARANDHEEVKDEELHNRHFVHCMLPKLFMVSQLLADEDQKIQMLAQLQEMHQAIVPE